MWKYIGIQIGYALSGKLNSFVNVLLPHAHAQGVKQSVCMSVVVVVVRTKIACLDDLGA